jgi:hypothetical protein
MSIIASIAVCSEYFMRNIRAGSCIIDKHHPDEYLGTVPNYSPFLKSLTHILPIA